MVLYTKKLGVWTAASKLWKKINGAWVEQADPQTAMDENVKYQSHLKTVTITGSGNSGGCYVKINGTTYTSEAALEVTSGTTVQCHVNTGFASSGYISVDGTKVAGSDYTYTANKNCAIVLSYYDGGTIYLRYGQIKITTS